MKICKLGTQKNCKIFIKREGQTDFYYNEVDLSQDEVDRLAGVFKNGKWNENDGSIAALSDKELKLLSFMGQVRLDMTSKYKPIDDLFALKTSLRKMAAEKQKPAKLFCYCQLLDSLDYIPDFASISAALKATCTPQSARTK